MGKYSREKGVRFERALARMFREEGLLCRRILEYDHGQGWDLQVGLTLRPFSPAHPEVTFWSPNIIIQAKATKNPADLARGLAEAMDHNPNAELWACIHRHNRKLLVLAATPSSVTPLAESWSDLIMQIKRRLPISQVAR